MPLTAKGSEVMAKLKKEYGPESGERVFYAMKNKGTLTGVDSDERADADGEWSVEWTGNDRQAKERSFKTEGEARRFFSERERQFNKQLDLYDPSGKLVKSAPNARRSDAAEPGTPEGQTPIPADYGTKLDVAEQKASDLMVRLGSYMDRNDGQMCNIADARRADAKKEIYNAALGKYVPVEVKKGNSRIQGPPKEDPGFASRSSRAEIPKEEKKDSDTEAERVGIDIHGKREMVR